ncbi:interleukin-11 isoform X2 [Dicentrarchus labrax]|uniref:Interleukin-11 n=1 Tax=Dicentrarchus labrax TaxID=13489 RepID=A0A8C4ITT4_DICLA|nr:interleukin-11 isoform X1 [Dicentrarchus labrax]XP_051245691.1 interleukin-11 isoform X2 [Dicentrarchus labrax]
MKYSASCLLHLLLLAELFVQSSSRPTNSPSLCAMFRPMVHQVERLRENSKLHELETDELQTFDGVEKRLDSLPVIQHDAGYFSSLKVNKTLSQLYANIQSYRLHVDWLKTAKANFSLSSQSVEGAITHLRHLSNLLNTALQQMSEEVPQTPSPSFPDVSTAFDVLRFSIEISDQLQVFCDWSKRVLRQLQRQSRCPRH